MAKPLPEEVQSLYVPQIKESIEFSKLDIIRVVVVLAITCLAFISGGV